MSQRENVVGLFSVRICFSAQDSEVKCVRLSPGGWAVASDYPQEIAAHPGHDVSESFSVPFFGLLFLLSLS